MSGCGTGQNIKMTAPINCSLFFLIPPESFDHRIDIIHTSLYDAIQETEEIGWDKVTIKEVHIREKLGLNGFECDMHITTIIIENADDAPLSCKIIKSSLRNFEKVSNNPQYLYVNHLGHENCTFTLIRPEDYNNITYNKFAISNIINRDIR